MSNPFKVGDKVRVLVDIKDAYQEVWHEAGSVDEITKIASDGEGLMFSTKLGTHYTNVEMVEPLEKSPLSQYIMLTLELHALINDGKLESQEADDIRDDMEIFHYRKMTQEQNDLVDSLSGALNAETDVREGKEPLTIRRFHKFTEVNDSEGETWYFYIPLTDEEIEKIKTTISDDPEEAYALSNETLTEEEVDIIIKHCNDGIGYMAPHNKCSGINLPDEIDMERDDPFYKGECWIEEVV